MKRSFCLLLALVLALPALLCAGAEENTFSTPYYTLTLPPDWIIDMEDLESGDGYEYLGCFYAPDEVGLAVFAYLEYYEDLKDISLWNADEAFLNDYAESVLEDLEDDDPELIGTVMANTIPFVLVKGTDKDGDYLYADTMTNGYAIEFECYVLDEFSEKQYPVTEKHIRQLTDILATFLPLT